MVIGQVRADEMPPCMPRSKASAGPDIPCHAGKPQAAEALGRDVGGTEPGPAVQDPGQAA